MPNSTVSISVKLPKIDIGLRQNLHKAWLKENGVVVLGLTDLGESYRVWCAWVWSWNLKNEEVQADSGYQTMKAK
jgi:hypothetical protein